MTRIARKDPGGQSYRATDKVLGRTHAMLIVIGDEGLRGSNRCKLFPKPARIEEKSVKLFALTRLSQVVWQVEIVIAPRQGIDLIRTLNPVESPQQTLVSGNNPLLPCLGLQEMAYGVMETQGASVEIETQEQGEIGKLVEDVLGFACVEPTGLGPKSPNDVDRDVGVFRKIPSSPNLACLA